MKEEEEDEEEEGEEESERGGRRRERRKYRKEEEEDLDVSWLNIALEPYCSKLSLCTGIGYFKYKCKSMFFNLGIFTICELQLQLPERHTGINLILPLYTVINITLEHEGWLILRSELRHLPNF